jgi:hypothetical protein
MVLDGEDAEAEFLRDLFGTLAGGDAGEHAPLAFREGAGGLGPGHILEGALDQAAAAFGGHEAAVGDGADRFQHLAERGRLRQKTEGAALERAAEGDRGHRAGEHQDLGARGGPHHQFDHVRSLHPGQDGIEDQYVRGQSPAQFHGGLRVPALARDAEVGGILEGVRQQSAEQLVIVDDDDRDGALAEGGIWHAVDTGAWTRGVQGWAAG